MNEIVGLPRLSDTGRAVLIAAAQIVAERSRSPQDAEKLLADPDGVLHLLRLIDRAASLRAGTRAALGSAASPLLSEDSAIRTRAIGALRRQIAQENSRKRRAERRAARPSAAEKAARYEESAAQSNRERRELAERRAENLAKEVSSLKEDNKVLASSLDELTDELDAMRAQIRRDRAIAADSRQVAAALSGLLSAPVAVPAQTTDSRGIQAGEPPLPRTRDELPPAEEGLSAAAMHAGFPETIAANVLAWLPTLLNAYADPPRPRVSVGRELNLTVDVLGGGVEIGGSCVLITVGGSRLLVDAGMRPNGTDSRSMAPAGIERALAAPLDAIIVTHAHNDHGGWVPVVVASQPGVPVLVTKPTGDLLKTMWYDSAKVLSRRADGSSPPPFHDGDVRRALDSIEPLGLGRRRRVGEMTVEFFPAGHIVGAVSVVVQAADRRVVVSGDVSGPGQLTVGGFDIPDSARGADLLLLESTYAGVSRPKPRDAAVKDFVAQVRETVELGGRVLVPAFAIGRAQEIALILGERLPDVDVLIDGLARDVTAVYEQQNGPDGRPLSIIGNRVRAVPKGRTRFESDRFESGVVITTSGMMNAGPAVRWAASILPDPRSSLLLVGYQDEDSPGRRLMGLSETGGGIFELDMPDGSTTAVTVAATVGQYQLGAHASADELVTIVAMSRADEVMPVHGLRGNQRIFVERLGRRGQATVSPEGVWRSGGD